jgi:hypothetical protein
VVGEDLPAEEHNVFEHHIRRLAHDGDAAVV